MVGMLRLHFNGCFESFDSIITTTQANNIRFVNATVIKPSVRTLISRFEKAHLGTRNRCKVVTVIEKDDIGSQKVKLEARAILKHPKLLKSVQ